MEALIRFGQADFSFSALPFGPPAARKQAKRKPSANPMLSASRKNLTNPHTPSLSAKPWGMWLQGPVTTPAKNRRREPKPVHPPKKTSGKIWRRQHRQTTNPSPKFHQNSISRTSGPHAYHTGPRPCLILPHWARARTRAVTAV